MDIEICLNEFFIDKYNLKTQVTEYHCNDFKIDYMRINAGDICVAIVILALTLVAIIGTYVDFFIKKANRGNHYYHSNKLKTVILTMSIPSE